MTLDPGRALALRYAIATGAASAIWSAALVTLAVNGRVAEIAWMFPAELVGGLVAPVLMRWLPPHKRMAVAAVVYIAARALLMPSLEVGLAATVPLCLIAGFGWRLLSAGVIATAASHSPVTVARCQSWAAAAATAGTASAALSIHAPTVLWPLLSVAIVVVARIPLPAAVVTPVAAASAGRRLHLPPVPVLITVAAIAGATTALPSLLPAVTAVVAGAGWVAAASVVAFAVTFATPALMSRFGRVSTGAALATAAVSVAVWLPAGLHPLVLLASVAVGNAARHVADAHMDTVASVGPDPARTMVNVQIVQGLASAAAGAAIAAIIGGVSFWMVPVILAVPLAIGALAAVFSPSPADEPACP